MQTATEEQAYQNLRNGLESGLAHFFDAYFPNLAFYAFRLTGDRPAAEDLASETFVKLWKFRESLDLNRSLKAWLYTTVHNACIDHLRKKGQLRKQQKGIDSLCTSSEEPIINNMIYAEVMATLTKSLEDLPPKCSQVAKLYYLQGKKNKEIATAMKISVHTVRNHKVPAIQKLKAILHLFK